MKLKSLIDEKFGLPGNPGREFGEKFMKDLIVSGKFAELWTAFEATYPKLQPELQKTFEKTNELLSYIKPEKGGDAYRVSQMDEAAAQELNNLLDNALETLEFVSNQNETPSKEMVIPVIKDFDNIFTDMLMIFTSNTAGDKPLEPYKQSNIGFKSSQYNEQIREVIKKTVAECWKTHKQVGMKKKGGKTVPNCVPKNEIETWDSKPSEKNTGKPFPAVGEAKTKPAKGHAYCARSAKIKKCKNPPCANTLSRKKWKCQGSRSVK